LFSIIALVGCLLHLLPKHYGRPRLVALRTPEGRRRRLWVARVVRRKVCRRKQLHFFPHSPGLAGVFRQFDDAGVRYAVLRWFDSLPQIEPHEDIDLLVADDSLAKVINIFESLPGIVPCDLYSETGLARSDYCGTPYYPAEAARRILAGAVRHKGLCLVPNPWDHFHSLAYHAVYHKAQRSNLPRDAKTPSANHNPEHDYAGILRRMAAELGIDVDVTFEDLHAYLEETGWAPSPEMLARLAAATRSNRWVQELARRVPAHVRDEGLAVFVLRQEAVRHGFQSEIVRMIREHGFELLAVHRLAADEIEHAAARCRGGNWVEEGPFDVPSGGPATVVVAYDAHPLPLSRRQRRKFSQRTNARIFVKELIRDAVIAQLPPGRSFNALHSSDHAAEAWHLIEVLAPHLLGPVRARLCEIHGAAPAVTPSLHQAA
jgi:hypothetical protein